MSDSIQKFEEDINIMDNGMGPNYFFSTSTHGKQIAKYISPEPNFEGQEEIVYLVEHKVFNNGQLISTDTFISNKNIEFADYNQQYRSIEMKFKLTI